MRNIIKKVFFLTVILFCIAATPGKLKYTYVEETGSKIIKTVWHITSGAGCLVLSSFKSGNYDIYVLGTTGETYKWTRINKNTNTNFIAKRECNAIYISGMIEGKNIDKKLPVDGRPWYQHIAFSLTRFVASGKDYIVFNVLRPSDLRNFTMNAKRQTVEPMTLNGSAVSACKVRVGLHGILSKFWHGYYWFNNDKNVFLRYEGRNGPPGTPRTVIKLVNFP